MNCKTENFRAKQVQHVHYAQKTHWNITIINKRLKNQAKIICKTNIRNKKSGSKTHYINVLW